MSSIRDIRILLFIAHAIGYPLAVLPPIFIDPLLKSHTVYPLRQYSYAIFCLPIYILLLSAQYFVLTKRKTLKSLYISVCIFLAATIVSLPIFLPELPHGNVFNVAVITAFFSAFAIFVWSIGDRISMDPTTLRSAGHETFEYLKALFAFLRQGAFAAVALFGALFFAAFTTGFKYIESIVTDKSDVFLLNLNLSFQIGFYALYSVIGPVRYFFVMNFHILSQFRDIAVRLDRKEAKAHKSSEA